MKDQENAAAVKQVKKTRRRKIGLIILGVLIILVIVYHKHIYYSARTSWAYCQLNKVDTDPEYKEVTLTKEQMIEDLDYLFGAAVDTVLSKEYAEKYYDADYGEIYNTFRERIQNCKDEYEFTALMIALGAKLPGGHSKVSAPSNILDSNFPMGKLADNNTRKVNYSLYRQFEDRMGEYDQKSVIAFYADGDYVLTESTFGSFESIEGLDYAKLMSLNGKPVKDVIKDIDTLNHWKYDETDGSVFVQEIFFNDSIGEKYDAEIMLKDGTVIHKDLYVSPEYNLAFYYRSRLYPEHYKKETAADSSADTDEETKSYSIVTDSDRKLVYAKIPKCISTETESVKADLKQALESADIENVILDFRQNPGGPFTFVTDGVLPAVLDHDAGLMNGEFFPNNEYSKDFCENIIYSAGLKIEKSGDRYHSEEDFTVKGEAAKSYNIYALTNHNTISTGDIFAYIAKQEGIPLIGQNTGGSGLTGNPLESYLPNSKLKFVFECGISNVFPEDGYAGVSPDHFVKNNWETYLKRQELLSENDTDDIMSYENRQKWDPYLLKALELIDTK